MIEAERTFGPGTDLAGDYDHQRPSQLLDGGGSWRFTKTQQLDFHAGFGLNGSIVDHYFGIGYSIRLDRLWGAASGNYWP
ncbi:MAG: transporter [Deltaproteobacteria bacterium]|nr:transporter [Deltaproteobacteria bacterium]